MRIFTFCILISLICSSHIFAGEGDDKDLSVFFLQPEIMIGKALPANTNFPDTRLQTIYSLSFGKYAYNLNKDWPAYYNYPFIGITFSKSSFGNDAALGNAYTLLPFISFNTSKKLKNSVQIKLGLGASYFTTYFDKVENPDNKAIGSACTWTFQTSVYYNIITTRHFNLNISAAYIHHSNGHTQLPNLGLNYSLPAFPQ